MKTIKNQLKNLSITLSMLVVFQSCTVYKSASVALEQAALEDVKVKVETNNGVNIKFKNIVFENENYYGIKKTKGKLDKILLNQEHINNIKIKDKTLSTILTIVLPLGILAGIGLAFKDSFEWKSNTFQLSP
ncbi:MAG: hypothetical protein V7719_02470 [Psychroserpens sp.]|uniref:hypothetical protein n=1 Tax=Psychroserpens sp. TaxID=2020870 RepID=UPI0030022E8F